MIMMMHQRIAMYLRILIMNLNKGKCMLLKEKVEVEKQHYYHL